MQFEGIFWFACLIIALAILQNRLHFEIQAISLLITRRMDLALALYSIFFFPGILLHESSHYLIARALGVRTAGFSLMPRPLPDGRLQLGYVVTSETDVFRDSLIGIAPLILGSICIAAIGIGSMDLTNFWQQVIGGSIPNLFDLIVTEVSKPDFWVWFYLVFVISSTMFPSRSDRGAWLPVGLFILLMIALVFIIGVGEWVLTNIAPAIYTGILVMTTILGISVGVHLILFPPLLVIRKLLSHLTGLKVA